MSTTNPQVRETEWDSLQRKFGNLPPLPQHVTEEELTRRAVNAAEALDPLEQRNLRELAALEDDVDEDVLEQYRRKRIAEIRRKKQLDRFGEVFQVSKDDFIEQVTRASAVDPTHRTREETGGDGDRDELDEHGRYRDPRMTSFSTPWGATSPFSAASAAANTETGTLRSAPRGTWVVVHLYRESVPASEALNNVLHEVAKRHRDIKFVKARAEDVIPDYPDRKIPTVLLYRGGTCLTQLIGRQRDWGAEKATISKFERILAQYGVLDSAGSGGEEGDGYISDDEEEETTRGGKHVRISYGGIQEGERRRRTRNDESDDEVETARTRGYASTRLDEKIERGF